LLGEVEGLSARTIGRLKARWVEEHQQWQKRSLRNKRYVYVWADGIYFNIRNQDDRQCILVLIGVTDTGDKELLGLEAGFRESELNWKALLLEFRLSRKKPKPITVLSKG
jgi:transposase-like protein